METFDADAILALANAIRAVSCHAYLEAIQVLGTVVAELAERVYAIEEANGGTN